MANPRLACMVQGGGTASLDSQTNFDQYAWAMFSMFKFAGTRTWADSLRSTYPGLQKILGYQIAGELRVNPGSVESGIYKGAADTHDAGLSGATNDYWVLRNNANWTLGTPSGAYSSSAGNGSSVDYIGNVGSTSFQNQWAANVIAKAQAAGIDGIFIDNCLGYTNGMVAFNPQTGVQYTDATWATAMASFMANVVPQLQAAGLYVMSNTFDGSSLAPGDAIWWDRIIGAGGNGLMVEQWLVNGAAARLDKNANSDFFSAWQTIPAVATGRGKDGHVLAAMVATDTVVRSYSYAAYLLGWDGTTNSKMWVGNVADNQGGWASTQVNPGTPAKRMEEVNADGTAAAGALATSLYRRYYTNGIVLLNAHPTNSYTITSFGDGRTYRDNTGAVVSTGFSLAPGAVKILTADTQYVGAALTQGVWTQIARAIPGSSTAGAMSKYAVTLNNDVLVNDLIVVAVKRNVGSSDIAGETVTDNLGNTYTAISAGDWDSSGPSQVTLYAGVVTKPGRPTIFGNFPTGSTFISMAAAAHRKPGYIPAIDVGITYGGSPQHQVLAGAGTDTIVLAPATTQNADLVVGAFANTSSVAAFTPGTGFAASAQDLGAGTLLLEHKVAGAAGATNVTASPAGAMNVAGVAAGFKSTAIPTNRRELVPIQPGDWLAVNDYLAGISIGGGFKQETLPIQAGDWAALNQFLADIPLGTATVRERLPLQAGNWDSLNQYLALL